MPCLRNARLEAAHDQLDPVRTADLLDEVERYRQAQKQIPKPSAGNYL